MGNAHLPEKVMLFCSIIYNEKAPVDKTISILQGHFGSPVMTTSKMLFNYTDYYNREMGSPLSRIIIAFSDLVERDSLPEVKIATNKIEDTSQEEGKRIFNLDPGILTLENICLATTKPFTHRIYLKDGIWTEITLMYQGNSYQKLPWTYPDYGSLELIGIFNSLRETYKRSVRCR